MNENGKINIVDAQIAYDIANSVYTGFEQLTVTGVLKADANNNMAVDALDARAIQVYVHTGSFAAN